MRSRELAFAENPRTSKSQRTGMVAGSRMRLQLKRLLPEPSLLSVYSELRIVGGYGRC